MPQKSVFPGLETQFLSKATVAIAATSALAFAMPAEAAMLTLGPLTFSEASGNFAITNGALTPNAFVLWQDVYGPDINLFMAIDGLRRACPYTGGCYFSVQSIVTNRTGTPWIFFDHELQEVFGVASPEADGLSFAQGLTQLRPFTSDRYAAADEVTDVRDFINFSTGVVAPGESVTFNYWIADTTPIDRFYLLQRPNYQVGGIGFVNPTPPPVVPPPIIPPVVTTPPSPQPSSPPVVAPDLEQGSGGGSSPGSGNSAAVPEPSSILGLLLFGAIAGVRKRKRYHRSDNC